MILSEIPQKIPSKNQILQIPLEIQNFFKNVFKDPLIHSSQVSFSGSSGANPAGIHNEILSMGSEENHQRNSLEIPSKMF